MSSVKTVVGMILFARNETTYNGAITLTGSTDTIDPTGELPVFNYQYAVEGARGGAVFGRGQHVRSGPTVRSTQGVVRMHLKGSGSAYTALVRPPNAHAFLQASGLSGSLEGGAWVYRPTPLGSSPFSLALDVYDRGELFPVRGAYSTFELTADAGLPVFSFDVQGLAGTITDVATPPARVFNAAAVIPPRLESTNLQIGSYTPKVRNFTYTHGLEISPRVDLNAVNAHAGFAIGRHANQFTVTIEADALSTYDPYGDWQAGTARTITLTIGSVANNRATLTLGNCVLTNVAKGADGPVATLDLTFAPGTLPDGNNDFVLSFN